MRPFHGLDPNSWGRRVLLTVLVTTAWAAVASAEPWRPIRPEDPTQRVRLSALPVSPEAVDEDDTWSRIDRADTLVFRYRGSGELRIDVRPVIDVAAYDGMVRYGTAYDDGTVRRFLRRSAADGEYGLRGIGEGPESAVPWTLGALDQHVIEVEPDSRSFRLFLRDDGADDVLVRCLVRGDLERMHAIYQDDEPAAAEWEWELRAGAAGYTDNAYLAPKSGPAKSDAAFWPVRGEVDVAWDDLLPFELDARYEFEGRFFDDPILNEREHRFDLDQTWDYGPRGRFHDVELRLTQTLRTEDDTFFGRGDFEEFETGSAPTTLSLADRFDYFQAELEAELSLEMSPAVEGILTARYHRRDYDEDYSTEPDVYALDQNRYRLEAEVRWEFRPETEIRLEGEWRLRHYDEKFSRALDGTEIVDEATRLRRWPLSIELRRSPALGLQWRLQAATLITQDLYEGYWDRNTRILRAELGWEFERGHEIEVGLRHSDTSYDNSRVGNVASGPLRDKSSLQWTLRGDFVLWPRVALLVEYEYEDRDNNSSLFAYERSVFIGGLVYRY